MSKKTKRLKKERTNRFLEQIRENNTKARKNVTDIAHKTAQHPAIGEPESISKSFTKRTETSSDIKIFRLIPYLLGFVRIVVIRFVNLCLHKKMCKKK